MSATPKKKAVKSTAARTPVRTPARQVRMAPAAASADANCTNIPEILPNMFGLTCRGNMILPFNGARWKHHATQQNHVSLAILAPSGADPDDLVGAVGKGGNQFFLQFLWGDEMKDVSTWNDQCWHGEYGAETVKGAAHTDCAIASEMSGLDDLGYGFEGKAARSLMVIDLPFTCEEVYCDTLGFRGYRMKDVENREGKVRTFVFVELVGVRTEVARKTRLVKEGVTRKKKFSPAGRSRRSQANAEVSPLPPMPVYYPVSLNGEAPKKSKRTYSSELEDMSMCGTTVSVKPHAAPTSPLDMTPGASQQTQIDHHTNQAVQQHQAMQYLAYLKSTHGPNWANLPEFNNFRG